MSTLDEKALKAAAYAFMRSDEDDEGLPNTVALGDAITAYLAALSGEGEPVAWRYRYRDFPDGAWQVHNQLPDPNADRPHRTEEPLYSAAQMAAATAKIAELEAKVEHLQAYAKHERSLGAEGPAMLANDLSHEIYALKEVLRSIREMVNHPNPDLARVIRWIDDVMAGYLEGGETPVHAIDRADKAEASLAATQARVREAHKQAHVLHVHLADCRDRRSDETAVPEDLQKAVEDSMTLAVLLEIDKQEPSNTPPLPKPEQEGGENG